MVGSGRYLDHRFWRIRLRSGIYPKRRTIPLVNFSKSSDVELHPDVKEEGVRRNHTREFKLECVRQVATGQKRPAQICREHNLSQSVLLRWRREYESRGESTFTEI